MARRRRAHRKPEGPDAPAGAGAGVRVAARDRFDLALGVGLGRLRGRVFRIGHLGALGELEVLATLGGVELALRECGHAVALGTGVAAAQERFLVTERTAAEAGLRA